MSNNTDSHFYIFPDDVNNESFIFKAMMSFFLILNLMVPLDLLIQILCVRALFTWLAVRQDTEFIGYEESVDAGEIIQLDIKNIEIYEDFVDTRHIFCDKTGTLTKNQLVF
mmetsp:Transcript_23967/g.36741  ORF Transcript_23967/g.36741 Transcript_23967/m.36741 type:complete len:111 (+) Transcript_23967:924-1256(+)